ncbi:MAG: hypothetical protein IJW20_01540 [Clostridia bacterium]|nr:hypothetical protein [Clostridia bacterium]
MENKDLNQRVLKRLEEKIAIEEFRKENNTQVKKKTNMFFKAASFIIVAGIVGGNIYTYATYNQNIISYVLDKLELFDVTQVNDVQVDENASLILESYGFDDNTLIVGYKLKVNNVEETFVNNMIDISRIIDGENVYGLERSIQMTLNKINDTEYEAIAVYNFDTSKISDNAIFETKIYLPKYLDTGEHIGEWSFRIPLESKRKVLDYEEYIFDDKKVTLKELKLEEIPENHIYKTLNLLEIKKSDLATKLVCYLDGYLTGGVDYFIEIIDENGEVILPSNIQRIPGGTPTEIVFKKIDFDSKITINISEVDGTEKLSEGTITIDLRNDIKKKARKEISYTTKKWQDLKLKYDEELDVDIYENNSTLHDGTIYRMDLRLYEYFGDKKEYNDFIRLECYENLENRTLEELAEFRRYVDSVSWGVHPFQEKYPIYLENRADAINLNRSEILELGKNREIIIDGQKINSENFTFNDFKFYNVKNTKLKEIDAIMWTESSSDVYNIYMFIYKGMVYELEVPNNIKNIETVKEFLDDIEFL